MKTMAKLAKIRQEIKLIQEIQHVTRTMKSIAAARWRAGKGMIEKTESFTSKLEKLLQVTSFYSSPLSSPQRKSLLLGIFSNKGLVGNFNQILAYKIKNFIQSQGENEVKLAILGSQGKILQQEVEKVVFSQELPIQQLPHYWDVREIVYKINALREKEKFTHIYLAFNRYLSVTQYKTEIIPVLPLSLKSQELKEKATEDPSDKYLFLSDINSLLEQLAFQYLFACTYQAIVESFLSEQATRLTIMDAATTHAQEMIESLTTLYHKKRQEKITQELNQVSSTYEVLERV